MTHTPRTLVCFAVPQESKPFRRRFPPSSQVEILVTGMGPQNAQRSFEQQLAHSTFDRVLTCGFAGGLNPAFRTGEVFFETSSTTLTANLKQAGAQEARFLCTNRVAITLAEKEQLRSRDGADLVEMESGIVQAECRRREIPCATVRVISDAADESLPLDFNALMTPDYRLSAFKMTGALLRHPSSIPGLMQLGRKTAHAADRLAEVLIRFLQLPQST